MYRRRSRTPGSHTSYRVERGYPRIDRSILRQTVNIVDELVRSSQRRQGFENAEEVRGAYPAICRVVEISPFALNPLSPRGFLSALVVLYFFLSNILRIFPSLVGGDACFGNVEGN